jgi:GNAT superfamily N-acetyltransferase
VESQGIETSRRGRVPADLVARFQAGCCAAGFTISAGMARVCWLGSGQVGVCVLSQESRGGLGVDEGVVDQPLDRAPLSSERAGVGQDGRVAVRLRVADAADGPFLIEMLIEAAYWRPDGPRGDAQAMLGDPELAHYVSGWPQPDDLGVIAEDGGPVGAAWLRLFSPESPGFGFVDDRTPELSMGVRVDRRGRGIGSQLLTELLTRGAVYAWWNVTMRTSLPSGSARV